MATSSMRTRRRWRAFAPTPPTSIGKPLWETPWFSGTEGMRESVRDAFIAVMQGEEVRTEMRLHLPIGERYFDFAMRPLRNQHGAIIGAVPEAIDITERRQGEEALRQSQKMEGDRSAHRRRGA